MARTSQAPRSRSNEQENSSRVLPPAKDRQRQGQRASAAHQPYTEREELHLVEFLADERPINVPYKGRGVPSLYQMLCDNPVKWPWATGRTSQSWNTYYNRNKDRINARVDLLLRKRAHEDGNPSPEKERPDADASGMDNDDVDELVSSSETVPQSSVQIDQPDHEASSPAAGTQHDTGTGSETDEAGMDNIIPDEDDLRAAVRYSRRDPNGDEDMLEDVEQSGGLDMLDADVHEDASQDKLDLDNMDWAAAFPVGTQTRALDDLPKLYRQLEKIPGSARSSEEYVLVALESANGESAEEPSGEENVIPKEDDIFAPAQALEPKPERITSPPLPASTIPPRDTRTIGDFRTHMAPNTRQRTDLKGKGKVPAFFADISMPPTLDPVPERFLPTPAQRQKPVVLTPSEPSGTAQNQSGWTPAQPQPLHPAHRPMLNNFRVPPGSNPNPYQMMIYEAVTAAEGNPDYYVADLPTRHRLILLKFSEKYETELEEVRFQYERAHTNLKVVEERLKAMHAYMEDFGKDLLRE